MPKLAPLTVNNLVLPRSAGFSLKVNKLNLKAGKIIGVVGANGSGKTSLVESIVGLARNSSGEIKVMGEPLHDNQLFAKSRIGFIPDDEAWFVAELTASEYFDLLIQLYERAGVKSDMAANVESLAEKLHFTSLHQQLSTLSHGNKKKVQIIAALINEPKIIIIDELRNGLDPISIKAAENLIKSLASNGAAVFAASHDLWWAERMADDIVMLKAGEIILHESTSKIIKEAGSVEAKFMELFAA